MIRHYEIAWTVAQGRQHGLGLPPVHEKDVHTLRFIRRGRSFGFSMAEISELLKLWRNKRRASADVKRIALTHADDLSRRIEEMESMKRTLERLADCCQGDQRPDCPIIDELAELTGFAGCRHRSKAQVLHI